MAASLSGRLAQQPLPGLLREIASRELGGILRLSRDRVTKSLAFEKGRLVNAYSSLPSEHLDSRLVKEGRTTLGLVSALKRAHPDPMTLGPALVEKGLVTEDALKKTAAELALHIALSLFEWPDAEYQLDELADSTGLQVVRIGAADLIAEGTRVAARIEAIAHTILPEGKLASPVPLTGTHFAADAKLSSTESYVLSLVSGPTRLDEIGSLSGLPEDEVRPSVSVLVALGLLTLVDAPQKQKEAPASESLDPLLQGIERKLRFFETADFYEVLALDRLATTATINRAFEQLDEMFQSYRIQYPDHVELNRRLDELFNKIKLAHRTLRDPLKRREYDASSGQQSPSRPVDHAHAGSSTTVADRGRSSPIAATPLSSVPRKPVPIPVSIPTPLRPKTASAPEAVIERGQTPTSGTARAQPPPRRPIPIPEIQMPVAPKNGNGAQIERGQWEGPGRVPHTPPRPVTGPLTRPPAVLSPEEASRFNSPSAANAAEQALHFYRQGKARFERREVDAAEHLFREAVRLDPSQSHYHFHLANVLAIRSQARHEHMHHEGCHVTCRLGGSLVSNPRVRYEAEQHLLKAAELEPSNAQILLRLGQLYKDAHLLKKAEHYLRRALMIDGKNQTVQRELNTLHGTESEEDPGVEFL